MTSTTFLKKLRSTNYRSLGIVGQGQFGQVYCAIHRKTGRLVALKNLNRDRFPTHQFLRELRFLLSLNHPHIANCLALEQSAYGRQLVLDYCEGGTLRDILEQETQLTLAEILTLIVEVLEALEHAQKERIVHCDIKPENILLTLTPNGWRAKVSDFGIARLSQEFQGDRSGATGSPAYMAPERFYHQYAISSDLYAIGVVLYELLIGDRPFSGNYDQLMVAHLNHAAKIPDTLPDGVRALLSKSMEKLMARRFRSAADMKAAIATTRKTLTASELRGCFPKPIVPAPNIQLTPSALIELPLPCQDMSVVQGTSESATLITYAHQTAQGWSLSEPTIVDNPQPHQLWRLPETIQRIVDTASGTIAVTDHALYQLSSNQSTQICARFENAIQLVQGGNRWIVAQSQSTPSQYWLIDTRGKVPQQPRPMHLPVAKGHSLALLLDDRHLLLADVLDSKTEISIFSRRGKFYGRLALQTPLHQIQSSQQPLRILAQAGPYRRDLLVIQVKPYRVMRCRLDITADWYGELITGFVIVSADGRLRLVNLQGQLIGKVDGLPEPRAIAFQRPHNIWLVSHSSNGSQLHCIDIRTLDLDIVF